MAKAVVDDELWTLIEPLIPVKPRRKTHPGRKPVDNRKALTGILFVLKTGIPWEDLPQEMGCGSGMTCWRRLNAWQQAGVWQQLHEVMLARLNQIDGIDWSRAVVDSSSVRAVLGRTNRSQPHRSRAIRTRACGQQTPPCHGCPGHSPRRSIDGGQCQRHHAIADFDRCHSTRAWQTRSTAPPS